MLLLMLGKGLEIAIKTGCDQHELNLPQHRIINKNWFTVILPSSQFISSSEICIYLNLKINLINYVGR